MVDKAALNDAKISLKAKGLLCYLLSKPPDWRPNIEDICNHCADGETAVRSALKELAKHGYAKLVKQQGDGGQWEGSFWSIIEKPASTEIEVSRISVNPHLKIVRLNKSTKNERILRDLPEYTAVGQEAPNKEWMIAQCRQMIASLLSGSIQGDFLPQWEQRAVASPWRVMRALAEVSNEVAAEKAGHIKLRNRGGRANWWYLNCDKPKKAFTN